MNNKLKQTLVIGLAVLTAVAATTTSIGLVVQQQTAYASKDPETGNNISEEEERQLEAEQQQDASNSDSSNSNSDSDTGNSDNGCTTAPASEPGWTIEICNGKQSYISPNGARCVYGEQSGNFACDDMKIMKGIAPSS